jgi:hypothetical protein
MASIAFVISQKIFSFAASLLTALKVLITSSIFGLAAKQGQMPSERATQVVRKRFMGKAPVAWDAVQMFQKSAEAMAFR